MPVLVFKGARAYGGAEGGRTRRKEGPAARTPPARGGIDAYFGYRRRMRRSGYLSRPVLLPSYEETLQGRNVSTPRKRY